MGNILTLVAMICAGFGAWNALSGELKETKTRVDAVEKRENMTNEKIKEAKEDLKVEIKEVKTDLKDLNRKIDFLIERSVPSRGR